MSLIHICFDNHVATPWWPTEQYVFGTMAKTRRKVFTECCCCWMLAHRTIARYWSRQTPVGDFGDYGYGDKDWPGFYPSMYDPRWEIRCDPDNGCSVNPRQANGAHLRAWAHYGV